jgi:membrane-associated phospholipid phosphatase
VTHLLDLELDLILGLRGMLPGLVGVFEMLTSLGNEMFYLLFMPLVYWCLDRATGARLTVLFLISAAANAGTKALFSQPRPFDYAPDRVGNLFAVPLAEAVERYEATGNGFPSGHTQNTVTIWGYLATQARRVRVPSFPAAGVLALIPAALLILLIPLSRIYLAVHFPRDVVGGYVIGAALLALFLWLEPVATAALIGLGPRWQVGIAMAVPAMGMLIYPHEATVTAGATLMGMGVGFALDRRWLHFETAGPVWQRALRYTLGVVGMLALYAGLKAIFVPLTPVLFWRFIRYTLMGLWGSLGAPWVFIRAGVATRRE